MRENSPLSIRRVVSSYTSSRLRGLTICGSPAGGSGGGGGSGMGSPDSSAFALFCHAAIMLEQAVAFHFVQQQIRDGPDERIGAVWRPIAHIAGRREVQHLILELHEIAGVLDDPARPDAVNVSAIKGADGLGAHRLTAGGRDERRPAHCGLWHGSLPVPCRRHNSARRRCGQRGIPGKP